MDTVSQLTRGDVDILADGTQPRSEPGAEHIEPLSRAQLTKAKRLPLIASPTKSTHSAIGSATM